MSLRNVNRGRAEEAPPARRARGAGARTRFPILSDGAYERQRTARASAASPGAGADSISARTTNGMVRQVLSMVSAFNVHKRIRADILGTTGNGVFVAEI